MRFQRQLLVKLFLLWMLLCPMFSPAQDSVNTVTSDKIIFTEQDILKDHDSIVKAEFEKGFKRNYESDEFDYEIKKKEKNAWERFLDWLSDFFRRLFNFGSNETSASFVEILIKTIAVVIVLVVIYLIVKSIMNKDGQWVFGRNSDKKMIRYEDVEKNLRITDFEQLIKEALQSGEKRLSIRYYYLWLLKQLAEKQHIEWDIEKTNSDYFHEIADEKLKHQFGYLSYLYNYIWYGEFDLDEERLEKAKLTFEQTIRSL